MTERNACGFRPETVAAEYETDAVLKEWGGSGFPPDDHYFWSAWRAEEELRTEDWRRAADERKDPPG